MTPVPKNIPLKHGRPGRWSRSGARNTDFMATLAPARHLSNADSARSRSPPLPRSSAVMFVEPAGNGTNCGQSRSAATEWRAVRTA